MKESVNTNEEFSVELRDYQTRDAGIIEERWSGDNAIMYQLPTGGGKSVVATKIIWDHKDEKTLVLAHRKELLVQMRAHLQNQGLKVGLIVRDKHYDLDANIIIASINTVARDNRIDMILAQKFDNVIVDEAHRILTNSYDKVISTLQEQNSDLKLLGLTATPTRRDKKSFADLFKTLITSESTQSLIDAGYLANYRTYYTPVKDLDKEVQKYFNDYKLSDLSAYMRKEEMVQYAVDSYKKLGEGRQTIVFCVDRKHAKDVTEAYIEAGYDKVAYLDGNTPEGEREQILEDFKDGKLTHVICIETLTEGVDVPETGCIQLLRPTLSLILYLQMVGRGLRPKADGSDLIILDNAGCATQFGTASSPKKWSLTSEDPNAGRKRNKVVGKRRDGTLTDDEDEMEFLELVEMSPEEFASQVSNSIETAEKKNEEIDQKRIDLIEGIAKLFIEKLPDASDWSFIRPGSGWDIDGNRIEIWNKKKAPKGENSRYCPHIKLTRKLNEENLVFISRETTTYDYAEYHATKAYTQIAIAKLWEVVIDKKAMKTIMKEWDKIKEKDVELEDKKVDIAELRRLVADAKEEQFENQVTAHFKKSNIFVFDNPRYEGGYFQGYSSWYIQAIEFPAGKIKGHQNSIIIHLRNYDGSNTRTRKKDYLKKDKLYAMLKEMKWNPESKLAQPKKEEA